eukprot:TRINITY_DN47328_c0_g1_i1.p1 TRINITY_DN47328_c0_g1~~TRINITY_DN47328_c0_g1_i1.p1  ORF type:complete len:682 (+),score=150.74 TRINITY_DN47328_c0_g1_i1:77-2047(+)
MAGPRGYREEGEEYDVPIAARLRDQELSSVATLTVPGLPLCSIRRIVDDLLTPAAREAGLRPAAPLRAVRLLVRNGSSAGWLELCSPLQIEAGSQIYAVLPGDDAAPPFRSTQPPRLAPRPARAPVTRSPAAAPPEPAEVAPPSASSRRPSSPSPSPYGGARSPPQRSAQHSVSPPGPYGGQHPVGGSLTAWVTPPRRGPSLGSGLLQSGQRPYASGSSPRRARSPLQGAPATRSWSPNRPPDNRYMSPAPVRQSRLWSPPQEDPWDSPRGNDADNPWSSPRPAAPSAPRRQSESGEAPSRAAPPSAPSEDGEGEEDEDGGSDQPSGREEMVRIHPRKGESLGITFVVRPGGAVEIEEVDAKGPAGRAGLPAGARITAVNGRPVRGSGDIKEAAAEAKAQGKPLEVTFVRPRANAVMMSTISSLEDAPAAQPRKQPPQKKEGALSTPEEAQDRVKVAQKIKHPEARRPGSAALQKAFPDKGLLRLMVVEKVNHRGKREKRALAATRYNVLLCTTEGEVRRVLQYRRLVGATAKPLGQGRCEVLLQCEPPEHDLLVTISDKDQPAEGTGQLSNCAAEFLSLVSRAREHMAGKPLPVTWLREGESTNLAKKGTLKKRKGWTDPHKIVAGHDQKDGLDWLVELSGADFAPPLKQPTSAP